MAAPAQKFHGIALANNSTADNFHFERLAADPAIVSGGRVWFNTTEKVLKYSGVDGVGAVTINTITNASDISSAVSAVQNSVTSLSTSTSTNLTQEIADRTAADAVVASNAADLVATETTARLAGDTALGGRIDTVQAELDATQAAVGLNVDGTFAAPQNTTYLGASTSIKGSVVLLDKAIADEVTARTAKDTAQDSALAAEVQSRSDAITNLQAQLTAYINQAVSGPATAGTAESARAIAAEAAIKTELDLTQASVGLAADGSLVPFTGTNYLNTASTVVAATAMLDTQLGVVTTGLAAEEAARAAANVSFSNSLQGEITARTAAVSSIQTELDTTQAGAGLEADGSYAAPTGSNYLNAATSLKDADFILDSAVKTLSAKVDNLSTATVSGLADQLANEVTRATGVETTLTAAVSAANSAIVSEATRAQTAESALSAQIASLTASVGSGTSALVTELNNGRYTFTAVTGALEHVIQHNLNTAYYLADIKVQGDDGIYRNDICPVEEIDSNSFRISLTEARKVKVGVMSLANL